MNKGINNMPISTSLYYTQTRYELDSNSELAENSKLKQEQVGLKVGPRSKPCDTSLPDHAWEGSQRLLPTHGEVRQAVDRLGEVERDGLDG